MVTLLIRVILITIRIFDNINTKHYYWRQVKLLNVDEKREYNILLKSDITFIFKKLRLGAC
jgi:hypothetical protein